MLPRLVKPLLAEPGHAVWLLPTPGFRRAAFARRGSLRQIAGKTSDPERALGNLLERDRMFTERLREETGPLELRAIEVDGTMTEDGLDERVTEAFGLCGGAAACGAFQGAANHLLISLGAAPGRDESRDRARANRSPEPLINGLAFTLEGLTLAR